MKGSKIRKTAAKTAAWVLSGVICAGNMMPAFAEENDTKDTDKDNATKETTEKEVEKTSKKDETVYAKLDADGNQKSVIVSDWLQNSNSEATLDDQSDLSDIKNVKGDETYASDANGGMVWSSAGNDIYYQGTTTKNLPISVKISYTLDGKSISASDLAGKSGHVVIRYDFTNNAKEDVEIDGKTYTVNTPFAVMTGMILPIDKFSNVTVSSGKVLSDGSKNIVAAMAFPGLSDSLKLSDIELAKDVDVPESFEIEADVEDFALDMTATVISNDLFDDIDLDSDDLDLSELTDAMDELTDASTQLVDGSKELLDGVETLQSSGTEFFDGLDTLASSSHELADGIATLDNSKGTLVDGVNQINSGAASLNSGAAQLQTGIDAYTDGTAQLNAGIQAYTQGTAALAQGTEAYVAGADTVAAGVAQLSEATKDLPTKAAELEAGMNLVLTGAKELGGDETIPAQYEAAFESALEGVTDIHNAVLLIQNSLSKTESEASVQSLDYSGLVNTLTTMRDNDQQVLNILTNVQSDVGTVDQYKVLAPETLQNKVNGYENDLSTSIATLQSNVTMANDAITVLNAMSQIPAVLDEEGSESGSTTPVETPTVEQLLAKFEAATTATPSTTAEKPNLYQGIAGLESKTVEMAEGNQELYEGIKTLANGIYTMTGTSATEMAPAQSGALDLLVDSINRLNAGCVKLTSNDAALTAGAKQLEASTPTLAGSSATLVSNNDTLRNGIAALASGTSTLSAGTNTLASGASTLSNGIGLLASGSTQLAAGADTLNNGGSQMSSGIDQLADGAKELSDGMVQFDEEGIQELTSKLSDLTDGSDDIIGRLKAVVKAGQNYQTFTQLSDSSSGSVKFILETEAIK